MDLARVCGQLVANHIEDGFHAQPLRLVQNLDPEGNPRGKPYIVLDRIGVADGQIVLIETAMEATLGMGVRCAADAAIVGIVDKY